MMDRRDRMLHIPVAPSPPKSRPSKRPPILGYLVRCLHATVSHPKTIAGCSTQLITSFSDSDQPIDTPTSECPFLTLKISRNSPLDPPFTRSPVRRTGTSSGVLHSKQFSVCTDDLMHRIVAANVQYIRSCNPLPAARHRFRDHSSRCLSPAHPGSIPSCLHLSIDDIHPTR